MTSCHSSDLNVLTTVKASINDTPWNAREPRISPKQPIDERHFETTIRDAVLQLEPLAQEKGVVLAVSGGRDSVAMTHALCRQGMHVELIHLNHGLRDDSADDATFVQSLADQLDVPCTVRSLELPARCSEETARNARYEAIREFASSVTAMTVATAHTADDQAETILHRAFRGTSLAGLAGMAPSRPLAENVTLIRPLLEVTRADVTAYLVSIDQQWRDDATNDQPLFTRNRLRNDILPLVRESINPQVTRALLRLGESAAEHTAFLERLASEQMAALPENATSIPLDVIGRLDPLLMTACFRHWWRARGWPEQRMTREHWQRLVDLVVTNRSNRHADLPGQITATRTRTAIVFSGNV